MYKLKVERFLSGSDWTIGEFRLIDKNTGFPVYNGFTLEPAGADEVQSGKDKRIPQGLYNAKFEYSPKFSPRLGQKLFPVIFNEKVCNSRRILIHQGNKGVDTDGCILLGNQWAKGFVYNSIYTINAVFDILKNADFEVEIINKGV